MISRREHHKSEQIDISVIIEKYDKNDYESDVIDTIGFLLQQLANAYAMVEKLEKEIQMYIHKRIDDH